MVSQLFLELSLSLGVCGESLRKLLANVVPGEPAIQPPLRFPIQECDNPAHFLLQQKNLLMAPLCSCPALGPLGSKDVVTFIVGVW